MMALEDMDFKSEDEDEGKSENSDYWLLLIIYISDSSNDCLHEYAFRFKTIGSIIAKSSF